MTALAVSRTMEFKQRTDPRGDLVELPVAAATKIYSGAFVGMLATGYVQPYVGSTVATTLTGFDRLVGVAVEEIDNSAGSAGDKTVRVLISGAIYHAVSGLAITDVGAPVFASDDNTLTKVALGNVFAGWVERFEASGYGIIRLPGPEGGGISPLFNRWSPAIDCTAANLALLVHPTENQNGLYVHSAWGIVTEQFGGDTEDQGIVTLQDTAGTTLGITLTPSDAGADAVGDIVAAVANSTLANAATGSALVMVPAGKGVQAKVTQLASGTSAAGGMKVGLIAIPGA